MQVPATTDIINVWGKTLRDSSTYSEYVQTSKSGKYQFPNLDVRWDNENCDNTGCSCRPKG